MKKSTLIGISLVTLLFFATGGMISVLNSSPLTVQDNVPVEEFSSVGIAIPATVYLEQGNKHSLDIDASDDMMEKIEVSVENGKLVIKPKNYTDKIKGDIVVRIVAPDYEEVSLAGSGKLFAEKKMNLDEVVLKIAGSGSMDFQSLEAEEVEVKISGSGNLSLAGSGATELSVSIAGSGNLNAENFEVNEFGAKISGSGNCRVFVNSELKASIAGSGSIYYKGTPQVDTSIAGSGKVKKM